MRRQTQVLSIGLGILLALGSGSAVAQGPALGPATAIDVRVKKVEWQPSGAALLYTRPAEKGEGQGIGLFMPGQKEGKVVVELGKDDSWETQWFDALPGAILNVYRMAEDGNQVTVYLLDAKTQTAKSIFGWRGAKGEKLDIDVDVSPTMYHAIFRMKVGDRTYHYVLPNGASQLMPSPDIDAAVHKGLSGPSWSVDGTAIYGQFDDAAMLTSQLTTLLFETEQLARQEQLAKQKEVPVLSNLPIIGKLFRPHRPEPVVGSEVMELVPSNAVLRPVRFRGPWENRSVAVTALETRSQGVQVQLGPVRANTSTLWLVPGGRKMLSEGILVAPGAGASWIAPGNRGIAYLVDGALFVKTFVQG